MKLIVSAIVASTYFLQASALPAGLQGRQPEDRRTANPCGYYATVPLLRAWSANWTDHFYTTDALELENAIISDGYVSQGDAAEVLSSRAPNSIPLYRAWNAKPGGTDHFYTTSSTEIDIVVQSGNYSYEGITAYVYPSALCGTAPLYQMYSPSAVDHFYTTNEAERSAAITTGGYTDEGIAAYVLPAKYVDAVRSGITAALNLTLASR